jgi:hypothetical protein
MVGRPGVCSGWSPPLGLAGAVGAARLVERVELGHVLVGEGEVEDLRVLDDAVAVRRLREDDEIVGDELWTGYTLGQLPTQPRPIFRSAAPVRLDPDDGTVLGAEGALAMTPAVDAGAYVVVRRVLGNAQAQLEVRDKTTGAIVWTAPLGLGGVPSPEMLPAVADGQVYVVDGQQRLLEFALGGCGAPTCAPTWASTPGGALSSFTSYPVVAP